METVNFSDDKGRVVQVNGSNYKGGTEVQTTRYGFGSQPVSSYYVHNNPAGGVSNLAVKTNMNYDHAGRLLNVKKKVNSEAARTVAIYTYDAMGQVKNKKIGQQKDETGTLTSTPLENQDYAFNIRGWLKGINWSNYGGSGKTAAQNNRWFAMDLSYDWGYDNNQYNGNIAGMRWQSGSDKEERAYGFGYDAVNRLLYADFNQYTSGAFNKNAGIDFTVKMGDGINTTSAYDENGNILQMQQWGMKGTSSTQIDNLQYRYYDYSNKLKNVYDQFNDATTKLGDFRTSANHPDGANATTTRIDYDYDVNGNLKKDLNKDVDDASIGGIVYNQLNLPWKVTVKNKGTIIYIYDAAGNKLEKRIDEPAAAGNGYQARQVATSYVSGFIYENNVLQFFAQEEGRVRDKKDANGAHVEYAYDYFLKDHLGNVRMTLTDEKRKDMYPAATMEDGLAATEEALYSNLTTTRADVPPGYPTDNSFSNPNLKIAKVGGPGSSSKIGPAIVLKVMAGDSVNFTVRSWYKLNGASTMPTSSVLTDLIAALSGSIGGVAGSKATSSQLSSSGLMSTAATDFLSTQSHNTAKPKAYVNWIFFDEQFKVVNSGLEPVGADQAFPLHVQNLFVNKNGYVYIFTSNESQNVNVYFDNLAVSQVRGSLMEENHYYAFGLTMAGISSRAIGMMGNNYKFNDGTELNTEFDWNMYETMFRGYDAQIGRFWQVDPLAGKLPFWSSYSFSFNNPICWNDPTGAIPGYDENGSSFSHWEYEQYANSGNLDVYYQMMYEQQQANYHGMQMEAWLMNIFNNAPSGYKIYNGTVPEGTQAGYHYANHDGRIQFTTPIDHGEIGYQEKEYVFFTGYVGALDFQETTSNMVFAGDKFEIMMARNDVSRGSLDAAAYQKAYNQYANIGTGIFVGTGVGIAGGYVYGAYQAWRGQQTVYRVFGGDSRAQGFSWTPVNPNTVGNFRDAAGLPSGGESGVTNTADFMIEGRVRTGNILGVRPARGLDGNAGGLPEYVIDPNNVKITNFSVLKP